jgi:hypothetical protein
MSGSYAIIYKNSHITGNDEKPGTDRGKSRGTQGSD